MFLMSGFVSLRETGKDRHHQILCNNVKQSDYQLVLCFFTLQGHVLVTSVGCFGKMKKTKERLCLASFTYISYSCICV